jgi:hypothetical protein
MIKMASMMKKKALCLRYLSFMGMFLGGDAHHWLHDGRVG